MADTFELALFAADAAGEIRLVGRLTDPDLLGAARARIADRRRRELERLERGRVTAPGLRVIQSLDEGEDP